ncbi:MAG: WecB/TagA/CpsF family glycosyltransferase [Candidatus Omnitrophica bacterium]|nr:WecB/TagA/CpsF family glycosyltransferase [Candidatus Omnitrophota bacterium]
MIYLGKFKIIDNLITACDYEYILNTIEKAIKKKKNLLISPIASHTLVKAHYDPILKKILDNFNYLLPDSQWVKRSIWFLYGKRLKERVYGPDLMIKICQLSQDKGYKIFLYGNKKETLEKLKEKLRKKIPRVNIVGEEPSKFRELTKKEWKELKEKIKESKADIIFVSLGSPKQEVFSYRLKRYIKEPKIIIPVGAAFDFISGAKKQAPKWMQRGGLEWLWRLWQEPRRVWRRYLVYSFKYLELLVKQKIS